mgnify:CR=1 FL=1
MSYENGFCSTRTYGLQKSVRDRAQASFLIDVLAEDRPDELREAQEDALSRGPKWREHVEAGLMRMPGTRARLAAL